MDADEIRSDPAFDSPWYYNLELAPDLFTNGHDHWAVGQTRDLLRRVDVGTDGGDAAAVRCLDIGIQEGLVTVLLERRGASEVVGYDRILRHRRLNLVQRALGTNFDLVGDMKLQDLPGALADRDPFDVVVFSGVMYHMFDPFGGLATVRGLVRDGGVCIVETAVVFTDGNAMHFNAGGAYAPFALWFLTPGCLDYLLRFLRLQPIDAVHLGDARGSMAPPRTGLRGLFVAGRRNDAPLTKGRMAVACRAVPEPVAEPGDDWISTTGRHHTDFAEFLDWDRVASRDPEVNYDASREQLVRRADGSVDLEATVASTPPLSFEREQAVLELAARY